MLEDSCFYNSVPAEWLP